jgi:hypothetical protein
MKCICFILSAIAVLGSTGQCRAYDEGYPFNQYGTYKYNTSECGSYFANHFDEGPYTASCRYTELAHIQRPDETIRKFIGIACGRGKTPDDAQFNARAHAIDLVQRMEHDDEDARGVDRSRNEIYVGNKNADHCVPTGRVDPSSADLVAPCVTGNEPTCSPVQTSLPDPSAATPPANQNIATFILHDGDRYTLGVEFFSRSRSHAWPGNNQQYNLSGTSTYNLNCVAGEKICFGAWRDYQTTQWGIGRDNQGCNNCCITCGNSMETTLTDGGPDAYPDNSANNGSLLNSLLAGANALVSGLSAVRPTAPRYTPRPQQAGPGPQGVSPTSSSVSGTGRLH